MHIRRRSSVRPSVSTALRLRLRAAGVLLVCLGTAAPVLVAAGDEPEVEGLDATTSAVVAAARAQVGDTYLWGGNGPDAWDCSGLTSYAWRDVGGVRDIPRNSAAQQQWAVPIPAEQARPGDLVFFGSPVSHVGLYAGGGRMVDAGSSRTLVTERAVWTGSTVRYGRVPRPGMTPVRPWTPPAAPETAPATSRPVTPPPSAASRPEPAPVVGSGPAREKTRSSRSRAAAAPAASGLVPLRGLPARQRGASSKVAVKAVAGARSVVGRKTFNDVSLVRAAWRHAGGGTLPASRDALVARGRPVPLADARVGDLVSYGPPTTSVALYAGSGYMVQASRSYGKVVVRRVFASPSVRFLRLR